MSRASKHILFVVLACSALLVGCSDDSSDSGDDDGDGDGSGVNLPDPCTFLSTGSLEPIVGDEITETENFVESGDPGCVWYNAQNDSLLTTVLYETSDVYDATKLTQSPPAISGVGADAYLGALGTVWVKMGNGVSFFTQSLVPVADSQISAQVQSAGTGKSEADLLEYEASYRMAKLVAGEL